MTTPDDKIFDEFFHLCNRLELTTDQIREVSDRLSDEAFSRDRYARGQQEELNQAISQLFPILTDIFNPYLHQTK